MLVVLLLSRGTIQHASSKAESTGSNRSRTVHGTMSVILMSVIFSNPAHPLLAGPATPAVAYSDYIFSQSSDHLRRPNNMVRG